MKPIRFTFGSVACVGCLVSAAIAEANQPVDVKFDVNDVSYLWPVPQTVTDVESLISADRPLMGGSTTVWPQEAFDSLLRETPNISIAGTTGARTIKFVDPDAFGRLSTWKVVAFRVDPSAPGTFPKFKEIAGESPQVRLIVQPVTISSDNRVVVHDVTAHLVFNYVERLEPGADGTDRSLPRPDKVKFQAIVNGLKELKSTLHAAGTETNGPLRVHPGFTQTEVPGFANQVESFLRQHLMHGELSAMAFMGVDDPEPWIFFAMVRDRSDGTFKVLANSPLGNATAQMLSFRDSPQVLPSPVPQNLGVGKGVSTALLFPDPSDTKLRTAVFPGEDRPNFADIPDIIANPHLTAFFNVDCVSCHSESARRQSLGITVTDAMFKYARPAGISGVDQRLLPTDGWNVRNLGWFPRRGIVSPTATLRTGNEAAESAEYINSEYLDSEP